jgi:hypothetical protein
MPALKIISHFHEIFQNTSISVDAASMFVFVPVRLLFPHTIAGNRFTFTACWDRLAVIYIMQQTIRATPLFTSSRLVPVYRKVPYRNVSLRYLTWRLLQLSDVTTADYSALRHSEVSGYRIPRIRQIDNFIEYIALESASVLKRYMLVDVLASYSVFSCRDVMRTLILPCHRMCLLTVALHGK